MDDLTRVHRERMEWRYGPAAHRVLPLDVGHVCQNHYLAPVGRKPA